jgi:hypothetical protein
MNARYRATDLLVPQRAQPSDLRGRILRDPGTYRVNDENIRETHDDRLAASPQFSGFGSHELQGTRDPITMRRVQCIDHDQARQKLDQLMRSRVIELKNSADCF